MTFFSNIFALVKNHALLWIDAIPALSSLVATLGAAFLSGEGPRGARVAAAFATAPAQRDFFAVLRAFQPNLTTSRVLVKAYENNGSNWVTRAEDVVEVLDRESDFAVVYEPKMRKLTGGENFFLGMQDSAEYQHDVSIMRLVMRREDVAQIIVPMARREAERLSALHPNRIDLPHDLTTRVPAHIVENYFGTPGPDQDQLIAWATILFWWLFQELSGNEQVEARALDAARKLCASVDETIASRKKSREKKDDLVGRALALQAGAPEFTDLAIRNNLVGLIIGAIPTLSKATVNAVDHLLSRPELLADARAAAQAEDETKLAPYVFEALRFNPINLVIYRRANRDATIAASTLRARRIKQGSMVFASNYSAMFDPLKVENPKEFRIDRPFGDYILWGYGMHTCFGAHLNRAVLPVIARPILARANLRRAEGPDGRIDGGDTPPFPQHFTLVND